MPATIVGSEKGGTGKSTIAANLAIMSSLMGKDTLLVDTDRQASSSRMIAKRHELGIIPNPSCVQIRGKYLHKEIEHLNDRFERIIVDAGGQDSVELRSAMSSPYAKKLFIPLIPSHFDLETLSIMDQIVMMAQSFNHNLEAHVIYNKAPTHSKIHVLDEAIELLKDYENLTLCKLSLYHRIAFQYCASNYLSIVEFELDRMKSLPTWQSKKYGAKASIEICELYSIVFDEPFAGEITDYIDRIISSPSTISAINI